MALIMRLTCAKPHCGQPVTQGKVWRDGRKVEAYVHVSERGGSVKAEHAVETVRSEKVGVS